MLRPARALLLLLAMVWQTLACLSPWAVAAQAALVAHAALHAQADAHHHHDDQSLHLDDSNAGTPHAHADPSLQPPGLLPGQAPAVMPLALAAPPSRAEHSGRPPLLAGLFRPPQHTA